MKTDRAILMICIGIAFVFWLFTKLSYNYDSSLVFELEYELPENKIFTNPAPENLQVSIRGRGWDLLGIHRGNNARKLLIDAAREDGKTLTLAYLRSLVAREVYRVDIKEISPDHIYTALENKIEKEVPIRFDGYIEIAPLYQYVDSMFLRPKTVKVVGPASIVRDIKYWETEPLVLQRVENNVSTVIALKEHPNKNIEFFPDHTIGTLNVEQVTEQKMEIPIVTKNVPDSLFLVVLPRTIEVSCMIGLSDYDRLSPGMFTAMVDFENIHLDAAQKTIKVELTDVPSFVTQVHYHPKKVDYIMRSSTLQN